MLGLILKDDLYMGKKIFVSSTFTDMIPHRKQIIKALSNFDVEILGMENFGARKSPPLETCLKDLELCDIYLGVIGFRYGSVNEQYDKSFTQLEYEKAVELGKDIKIFLLDEQNGILKTGCIDFGIQLKRLLEFRELLKKKHTVEFFLEEKDLGIKIYNEFKDIITNRNTQRKRPKQLECRLFRYELEDLKWICFVGYLNGKPFELYNTLSEDEDGIFLPDSINEGVLIEEKDENMNRRIDFFFLNKRGYRCTVEEINSEFNPWTYKFDNIISNLLRNEVKLDVIIQTINEMTITAERNLVNWNKKIIEILK